MGWRMWVAKQIIKAAQSIEAAAKARELAKNVKQVTKSIVKHEVKEQIKSKIKEELQVSPHSIRDAFGQARSISDSTLKGTAFQSIADELLGKKTAELAKAGRKFLKRQDITATKFKRLGMFDKVNNVVDNAKRAIGTMTRADSFENNLADYPDVSVKQSIQEIIDRCIENMDTANCYEPDAVDIFNRMTELSDDLVDVDDEFWEEMEAMQQAFYSAYIQRGGEDYYANQTAIEKAEDCLSMMEGYIDAQED